MITAKEARELLDKELEKSNGQWLVKIEEQIMWIIKQKKGNVITIDYQDLDKEDRVETLKSFGYKVLGKRFLDSENDYWMISW